MTAPVPTSLPFGMRDCKLYPYEDAFGTILGAFGYDLPNSQTFSFADNEDFTDLRGDDELVATHGNGAQVNWSLESGGISLQCWAVFTGGQILEEGTAPNRKITLRKCSDDARPYFKVVGQIMSDAGGDVQAVVYRAKCNGDISGQFGDGQFFVTTANGIGLPIPGTKLLYDLVQNEQKSFVSEESTPNPIMPPRNVVVGNVTGEGVTVVFEAISGATGYNVQYGQADVHGAVTTWENAQTVTPDAGAHQITVPVTGLTSATHYQVRVATTVGSDTGDYGVGVDFTTA